MLLSMRWWVTCHQKGDDPRARLSQGLGRAGAPDAEYSIDGLMTVVSRTAQRRVDIRCPHCPSLSDDEATLLHAARLAQEGRPDLAERYLRLHLLTDAGAAFAIGPLEGLGLLFAQAGLRLGRRRLGDASQQPHSETSRPEDAHPEGAHPKGSHPAWATSEGCSRTIH